MTSPTGPTTTTEPLPPDTISCSNSGGTQDITVSPGESVTWTNDAGEKMGLDFSEDAPTGFNPQSVESGSSTEATFPDAGTFTYTCGYDSGTDQTGVITVQ